MATRADNRCASPHAQRGVAAIFAAISLITLVSALALGIDIGRLYYAQRDLQRLADLAAVDAARFAQGCLLGPADPAMALSEAQASLARNGMPSGTAVVAEMGVRTSVDGEFKFRSATANDVADSVQVRLARPSPARILPLFAGDDSRTLTAQAAALSLPLSSDVFTAGIATAGSPDLLNPFFGGRLGGGVNVGLSGYRAVASANVRVGDIIANAGAGSDPLSLPQPPEFIRGLLRQIAETLDATGDGLAAAAVRAFADASNNLGNAIPAQLLGIPLGTPRTAYENLRVNVGMVIGNVAAIASQQGPLILPINLPFPLGDQTITVDPRFIPGADGVGVPSVGNASTNNTDFSVGLGGLVTINLQLISPALGVPIQVPVKILVRPAARSLHPDIECRRRGLDMPRATYQANGTVGRFSLDASQDYRSTDINLGVLQSLTGLPVGGLLTPLNIAGQTIRIHASAGPVEVGDGSTRTLVMDCPQDTSGGPRDVKRFDCINSSATIGAISAQQAIQEAVPALVSSVHLDINVLPGAGTPVDLSRLQPLLDALNSSLSAALKDQLNLLASQIIPILNGVNLNVGGSLLVLTSITDPAPQLYAQ